MSNLDEIREMMAWELAELAGCLTPDTQHSPGGLLLTQVRDAVVEAWETEGGEVGDDRMHEIADSAPDIYTHTRWAEFVDLGAYQEEPESGQWPEDLTDAAGIALYQIADRLVHALADRLTETPDDASDDD